MITAQNISSVRPYWQIALQWLSAVLLFISFGTCLFAYNLSGLTERTTAVNLSTTITTKVFDQSGLANQLNFDQLKGLATAMPDGTILSIPQFPVVHLSKQDVLSLSQTQLTASFFNQVTSAIYDHGVAGAAATFATDRAIQQDIATQAAPLNLFTKATHDLAQKVFTVTLGISAVLTILLALLSRGWGRLASVGIVLLLVSPIGAVTALLLAHTGLGTQLSSLATPAIIQAISDNLTHSYTNAAIAGVGLLILAGLGKIITALIRRTKATPLAARTTN